MSSFEQEVAARVQANGEDESLHAGARAFLLASIKAQYSYNFAWLGRPIIQYPQDVMAMQELIWRVRPDLIIETGIAHGGSLIMSASMLALLDYCDAVEAGIPLDPRKAHSRVLGIDIDIRAHNRAAIEAHPMSHRIDMIQGSSVAPDIVSKVHQIAAGYSRVLLCLDSNHTHEHVLAELEAYAPLTSRGSYCCVFDTVVEDLPAEMLHGRHWGAGDSPKSAVAEYLGRIQREGRTAVDGTPLALAVDHAIENKLQITVAPGGFLQRV